MADPQQSLAKVPQFRGQMPSLLVQDGSSICDTDLTADTSPERYVYSYMGNEDEGPEEQEYARITGFDIDYTNADNLSFNGFRSMRGYLSGGAAHYLVSERRWSNEGDSDETVGQKNVIIIFVGIATIEECLVCEKSETILPVNRAFDALMDTLGMHTRRTRNPLAFTFLRAIRNAFIASRRAEIEIHLRDCNGSPSEPSDLSGLDRMVLDVMDRHIAFLITKKPLARLAVPFPLEKTLRLRLIQVKNQLARKSGIEKCFTTFVPTIPAAQQIAWPRAGKAAAWDAAQAKLRASQSTLEIVSNLNEGSECIRPTNLEASTDARASSNLILPPVIPGILTDAPMSSLPSVPDSSAAHPDALSGLQIFKTATCQVRNVIRRSQDTIMFKKFVGQVENDIEQFHATLRSSLTLVKPSPASETGTPGPELDLILDHQHTRTLMLIGLGLIQQQWKEQYLTEQDRQKIISDIETELRMIKEAASHVYSARA